MQVLPEGLPLRLPGRLGGFQMMCLHQISCWMQALNPMLSSRHLQHQYLHAQPTGGLDKDPADAD